MRSLLFLLLASCMVSFVSAQTPPASPPPEAAQFDFWIGEWEVTLPNGKVAGTNKIERIASGRGLLENWSGSGGFSGKSVNAFNSSKKQWQQFWVGSDGTVLELTGALTPAGAMVLGDAVNRITWTPNEDGTVRQLWETTNDGGKTWSVAFDGKYVRRK